MTYNVKKKKKLDMFKTLYKSCLMNVGVTKSARAIMGSPLPYLGLKISTLSQRFNSDGNISPFPIFLVLKS